MRLLVYTCVFGGYDRIFPPVELDSTLDYVAITDDPELRVIGWRSVFVDSSRFPDAKSANRHFKMLAHREFPEYAASIYVDGNVRLIGSPKDLLKAFISSRAAIGLFPHPTRSSVAEEVEACVRGKKGENPASLAAELESYRTAGFDDREGLFEAGILLKNHSNPALDAAMSLWWDSYAHWQSRDQISLPYVLWKTGLDTYRQPSSFRVSNPYFGIYPHLGGRHVSAGYVYVSARAHDSLLFRAMLGGWHAKWRVQRWLRSIMAKVQ